MSERTLRDISGYELRGADVPYLQRKISAAGEMKTAIKRLLDEQMAMTTSPHGVGSTRRKPSHMIVPARRLRELRRAMEDYLNVE